MKLKFPDSIYFLCWFFLIVFLLFCFLTIFEIRSHAADHKSGSFGKSAPGFHTSSHGVSTSSHEGVKPISPSISRETYPDHIPGSSYPRPTHRTVHHKAIINRGAPVMSVSPGAITPPVSASPNYFYYSDQPQIYSSFVYCRAAEGHWIKMEDGREIWEHGEIIPCD